jgi:Mrp family chromosome partitioning ATPase
MKGTAMTDLSQFSSLVPLDHGLAVVVVTRPDGTAHGSVVSAGVLSHPVTGRPVLGICEPAPAPPSSYALATAGQRSKARSSWPDRPTSFPASMPSG